MDKIITKSLYSPKIHKSYYLFHMFRKSTSIYLVFFLGLVVIWFALNNTLAEGAEIGTILISWALAMFTLLFTPMLMMGRINGIIKQETKSRQQSIEVIEITKEKLTRKVDGVFEKVVFGWNDILSAYETNDCFYLYVSKEAALVVVKQDMVTGTSETLRKLIEKNIKKSKKGKIPFKQYIKEAKK